MKIIVDKMPESPEECIFSERSTSPNYGGFVCTLRPYIPQAGRGCKPKCICRSVENCGLLKEMKE